MTVQNLWTFGLETDFPTVSYISDELRKEDLEELGIDLSESALSDIQKRQSENLLHSYADVFSKVKRDIGKCSWGVQHRIPLKAGATPGKQQVRSPFCLSGRSQVWIESYVGRWHYREIQLRMG